MLSFVAALPLPTATYPGSRIHRVDLTAAQKAAHPKYKSVCGAGRCCPRPLSRPPPSNIEKKSTKVTFADFTVSLEAQQARLAAVAAAGGAAGASAGPQAAKKAKK